MPNYDLVINSRFTPFSYQEMLAPVLMASQMHQDLENQYGDLEANAKTWSSKTNEYKDPYAYSLYKNYSDELENQSNKLAQEGLNSTSRKNLLKMRARYREEITPIEEAYKRRELLADEQRKMRASNPTIFYQRDAANLSLDDFIRNPSLDYGEQYSGALLAQQVGQMAANLKNVLRNKGKLNGVLPYQYEQLLQYGYSPEQIERAISNPQKGDPILNNIIEQALEASGMKSWASQEQLVKARAYANEGLYNAIGKTDIKNYVDNFSMQEALEKRREARARAAAAAATPPLKDGFALNPSNIFSALEKDAKTKKIEDDKRKFSQYFYQENGVYKLSKKGWDEYNKVLYTPAVVSPTGVVISKGGQKDSEFKTFVDKTLGGKGSISSKGIGPHQKATLGKLWGKYLTSEENVGYDATKLTEYKYDLDPSPEAQRVYKKKLSMALPESQELKEVDLDPKTNKWKTTGKTLPFKKLDSEDYTIVTRAPGELGNTMFIQKQGERAKRYLVPAGINITAEEARNEAIANRLLTQKLLAKPNLTPEQRAKLEAHYDDLTQIQHMYESQLDVVNTTKKQEHQPYYVP